MTTPHHPPEPIQTGEIAPLTDYGLGTYKGAPLVLVPVRMSGCYHRHDHGGRIDGVTFTESFMRNDWGQRPCKVCFGGAS